MQDSYLLGEQACQQGYRVKPYEIVTSTNLVAAQFAKQQDEGKLWIVSNQQEQGVGRRGRVWHSPKGNLYASLLLIADFAAEQTAMLGFVAGVAMAEAIEHSPVFATKARPKIQLKWPNDVLLSRAKCTGILLERILVATNRYAIIIGIGVNVVEAPQVPAYATSCLTQAGINTNAAQFFTRLSQFWAQNFTLWNEGRDFAKIRQKWLAYAVGLGERIYIETAKQKLSGIFTTIDEQGQLMLKTDDGEYLNICAGEVHFGTVMRRPLDFEKRISDVG